MSVALLNMALCVNLIIVHVSHLQRRIGCGNWRNGRERLKSYDNLRN